MTEKTDNVFDVIVVGGGPAGATAADDLARDGFRVMLLDRAGRIKPCGGAIPPRLVQDFAIPPDLLAARITSARIVSPKSRVADMPINGGYVGMVDRDVFDEWLRQRAERNGAVRCTGTFIKLEHDANGAAVVTYRRRLDDGFQQVACARAHVVVGADGAKYHV